MKKQVMKSFGVMFATTALLLSCNRNETPNDNERGAIDISVKIESSGVQQFASPTKAAAMASKTQFVVNDQIGLWVVPFAVTDDVNSANNVRTEMRPAGNYLDNVLHKFTAGKFAPITPIYYPNATARVDLYSVFPYDPLMSDRTNNSMTDPKAFAFAVELDQNQSAGAAIVQSDIMTALHSGAKDGSDGVLTFNHRLSRVLIAFNLGSTYKGANIVSVKSLKLSGVQLKSLINITDTAAVPTINPTNNPKTEIIAYQAEKPSAGAIAGSYTYEAIVIPGLQYAKGDLLVRLTLEIVGLGDVDFLCEAPRAMSYDAKKQTNITLDIMDKTPIAYGSVSIQGWGDPIEIVVGSSKPSLMNFKVTNDVSSRAANVRYAELGVDDTTYIATVVLDADVLKCTYLQPDDRFGDKLKSLKLLADDKVTTISFVSATPAISNLNIPGDPTLQNYAEIISTLKFD